MAIDVTVQDASDGIDVTVSGGAVNRPSISDGGSEVISDAQDINFSNALDASDDGDSTATVDVSTDGIQIDELDLSITPTWTGDHTFNSNIDASDNVIETGSHVNYSDIRR